jgi:hypothetical protein
VRLQITHPEVAARTCDECITWVFDVKSGRLIRDKATGEPIERPRGSRTPCHSCAKCHTEGQGSPEEGRESDLSDRNKRTIELYYEQLVVKTPTDDIMRHNFGLIHRTLDEYDRLMRKLALEKPSV